MSHRRLSLRPHYFAIPFEDRDFLIENAREHLKAVDFDTIVCTGLSGVTAGALLAHALGKELVVVRKADDTSTHSTRKAEGYLGERWLFVDDFTDSGATLVRARRIIESVCQDYAFTQLVNPSNHPHQTTYVGAYLYNRVIPFRRPGLEMKDDYELGEEGR